jgi:hypothetical protein
MVDVPRIALAVFIGFVVTTALSIGTDIALVLAGISPQSGDIMSSQSRLLFASSYRAVFGVLGAFAAATVANIHYKRAVLALGIVGTLLAVVGIFAQWDHWNRATAWYPISLAVLAIPYCLIGGRLYERYKSVKS